MSVITIGTPFAAGGLVYISSGYVLDLRRPVYAIRPGASGYITLPAGATSRMIRAPDSSRSFVSRGRLMM